MITLAYAGGLQIHSTRNVAVSGWTRTVTPRRVQAPRPQDHGAIDSSRFYDGAVISLTGYVRGDTVGEAHQWLDRVRAAFALGPAPVLLRWRREGLDYLERNEVRPAGPLDAPYGGSVRLIRWGVELVSEEAPALSDTLNVASYDLSTPDTVGVEFPLEFPLTWVSTGPDTIARLHVTNAGNFPTSPQYVITGPVDDPQVVNETTGLSIITTGVSLDPGETLYLNVRDRTCRLGSATGALRADLIDAAATDWGPLVPGPNVLRLAGSGTDPGTTTLSVSWRDARI